MTSISSGTSTERIVRALLLSLLVDVFAVMYLYDGYIGYVQKNSRHLAGLLGLQGHSPPVDSRLGADRGKRVGESIRAGDPLEKLSSELGPPAVRQQDAAYFLGPGGWLEVKLSGDRVESAKWVNGPHTESDQRMQQWIGWILVVVGFAATINLARVLGTKAKLTKDGLQVTGRPLIPLETMTGLRWPGGSDGVLELDYTHGGATSTIRLDPYIYRHAAAIGQAIAQRRGFN